MERFLESVADSVSQLVLFSVDLTDKPTESSEESGVIVRESATQLNNTVKKLALFTSKEEKVDKSINEVSERVQQIVENSIILSTDLFDEDAKRMILEGSRTLLQNIVSCLQLNDIYQCTRILRHCESVSEELFNLRNAVEAGSVEDYERSASSLLQLSIQLVKEAHERSRIIPQTYTSSIQRSKETILGNLQSLITTSCRCIEEPENKELQEERQTRENNIHEALGELVLIANESSSGLFDNLSGDLDLMTVFEAADNSEPSTGLNKVIVSLQESLTALLAHTKNGDKLSTIEELKSIRPLLPQVSTYLSPCIKANQLVAMSKSCLLHPKDESSFQELSNSVDHLNNALTALQQREKLPTSLTDSLHETISFIISQSEDSLESLGQSVFLSDRARSIQAAKKSLQLLNQASQLAAGLTDRLDDVNLSDYFKATNKAIQSAMPPLVASTKEALLSSESRREFVIAKDFALFAVYALLPPKDVVHPEIQILSNVKHIQHSLTSLRYDLAQKEGGEVQTELKGLLEAAKESTRSIQAYIPFAKSPKILQKACFDMANKYMSKLGHSVMEELNDERGDTFQLVHETSLSNALILSAVFQDQLQRLEENSEKLEPYFVEESVTKDVFNDEEVYASWMDLMNEQVVLAFSLSQEPQGSSYKDLMDTASELTVELGVFENTKVKELEGMKRMHMLLKKMLPHKDSGEKRSDLLQRIEASTSRKESRATKETNSESLNQEESPSTATSNILEAAKAIIVSLERLGKNGDRAEMIKTARLISNQAHIMVKNATTFIRRCSNRRLAEPLQLASVSARTKCVQLKILCAVQAASADGCGNEHLTGCITGLMEDLQTIISSVEIAALRVK